MNIYEIQWSDGEKSWVCANTSIHALKTYCGTNETDIFAFDDGDKIFELPKEKWGEYFLTDEDNKPTITFEEWMKENSDYPHLISDTHYLNKY